MVVECVFVRKKYILSNSKLSFQPHQHVIIIFRKFKLTKQKKNYTVLLIENTSKPLLVNTFHSIKVGP